MITYSHFCCSKNETHRCRIYRRSDITFRLVIYVLIERKNARLPILLCSMRPSSSRTRASIARSHPLAPYCLLFMGTQTKFNSSAIGMVCVPQFHWNGVCTTIPLEWCVYHNYIGMVCVPQFHWNGVCTTIPLEWCVYCITIRMVFVKRFLCNNSLNKTKSLQQFLIVPSQLLPV